MHRIRKSAVAAAGLWVCGGFAFAELPVLQDEDRAATAYRAAERQFLAGDLEEATRLMKEVARKYRDAPEAPRAQYRIAEFAMRQGEYVEAFDALDALIARFPESDLFLKAVEGQTEIAFRVLDRNRVKRVANPNKKLATEDRELAISMLRRTLERARHAPESARAQYLLATALDESDLPAEAAREHEIVLERYPGTPEAADSMFQLAYMRYRTAKGRIGDLIATKAARDAFSDFLLKHPSDPRAPEARAAVAEMGGRDRSQLLGVAAWYERTGNPGAAARTYREALALGGTPEQTSEIAARLERLESPAGTPARADAPSHDRNIDVFIPRTLIPRESGSHATP